jgi:peptidoglycan/xylan/chitin deacetylase (PgdA/CDA1 family)
MPPSLIIRVDRWVARRAMKREMPLGHKPGVISFSFDDAFRTACNAGRRILEEHGCRGTYYVAGGLTGQREQGLDCHTRDDLETLLANGHQVGCHTFLHTACDRLPKARLAVELDRNSAFLAGLGLPADGLHFAFPHGAYGWRVQRHCADRFQSLRIAGGGIHAGRADLNALKSEGLYEATVSPKRLNALVGQTAAQRGWLIFRGHDVQIGPSRWGCSPQTLDAAVRSALEAGCRVMTVAEAITYWKS